MKINQTQLEKLELLANKKVVTRVSSSIQEYRNKHFAIVEKRRLDYEKLMGEYKTENEAHEAYGWGYITEEQYENVKEMLKVGDSMINQTTEFEMAADILSEMLSPVHALIRMLEYNQMTDEQKEKHDKSIENWKKHVAEVKERLHV
jgi:hypothetical protein